MKKLISIALVMAIFILTSCDKEVDIKDGPVDFRVTKTTLITKELNPKFFRKGIDYERIHKKYSQAQLILAVGFQPELESIIPSGLCAENGQILDNIVRKQTGILLIDKDGQLTLEHGSSLKNIPMLKSVWTQNSAIQLQSLIRGDNTASFENDIQEDHFILVEDEDERIFVWSYADKKLSNVISDLKDRNVQRALKLGGGSANGGIFFPPLKEGMMLGQDLSKSPTLVALLLIEVTSL